MAKSKKKPTDNIFYVYQLRRADQDHPFYIGKGHNDRAYEHLTPFLLNEHAGGNLHKKRTIKKAQRNNVEVLIEFVQSNLTEADAFSLECAEIAKWGRRDLGTGVLTNMCDGGQGSAGRVATEETKRKISKAHTGRIRNLKPEVVASVSAKIRESKIAKSLAQGGSKLSTEQATALILDMTAGKTNIELADSFGVSHSAVDNIRNGRDWRALVIKLGYDPDNLPVSPTKMINKPKLSEAETTAVIHLIAEGKLSNVEISKLYPKIHKDSISEIRAGRTRRQLVIAAGYDPDNLPPARKGNPKHHKPLANTT